MHEVGWVGPARGMWVEKTWFPEPALPAGQYSWGSSTHWLLLCAPDDGLVRDGTLKLLGRLSLLSEEILWAANGLPNPFCSSDHLCLLASFSMEVTAP